MTQPSGGPVRVTRNPDKQRYEIWSGDQLAGYSRYNERDQLTVFTHTQIDSAFSGQGLGSTLVRESLDDVVRRGRIIVPVCPFVTRVLRGTSDYDDHVRWPEAAGHE